MNTEHDGTVRHGLCSQDSGPEYGPETGPPDGPNSWPFADAWKSKARLIDGWIMDGWIDGWMLLLVMMMVRIC